jgi:hypothetical protein
MKFQSDETFFYSSLLKMTAVQQQQCDQTFCEKNRPILSQKPPKMELYYKGIFTQRNYYFRNLKTNSSQNLGLFGANLGGFLEQLRQISATFFRKKCPQTAKFSPIWSH